MTLNQTSEDLLREMVKKSIKGVMTEKEFDKVKKLDEKLDIDYLANWMIMLVEEFIEVDEKIEGFEKRLENSKGEMDGESLLCLDELSDTIRDIAPKRHEDLLNAMKLVKYLSKKWDESIDDTDFDILYNRLRDLNRF